MVLVERVGEYERVGHRLILENLVSAASVSVWLVYVREVLKG